jgi:hypothetical protein
MRAGCKIHLERNCPEVGQETVIRKMIMRGSSIATVLEFWTALRFNSKIPFNTLGLLASCLLEGLWLICLTRTDILSNMKANKVVR